MREPYAKLTKEAKRVFDALNVPGLTDAMKRVWECLWILHNGPQGAFIGADKVAAKLGLSRDGVERARRELKAMGLLISKSVEKRKTASWYPYLPDRFIPPPDSQDDVIIPIARLASDALRAQPFDVMAYGDTPSARSQRIKMAYGGTPSPVVQTLKMAHGHTPLDGAALPTLSPGSGVPPAASNPEDGVSPYAPEGVSPSERETTTPPQSVQTSLTLLAVHGGGGSHEPDEGKPEFDWRAEFRASAARTAESMARIAEA